MTFDVDVIRQDFPILSRTVGQHPLVYLDSANTSQKPRQVVDAIAEHYLQHNANVRVPCTCLAPKPPRPYEDARSLVAFFIGAAAPEEIIFTKNASEALNLAANTLGSRLGPGDEVVISVMEHHSNIVPWQLQEQRKGIVLKVIPMTDEGELLLEEYEKLFTERTKLVSVTQVKQCSWYPSIL